MALSAVMAGRVEGDATFNRTWIDSGVVQMVWGGWLGLLGGCELRYR